MTTNTGKTQGVPKPIERVLITQPRPTSSKSLYFDIEKDFNLKMEFQAFIRLDPIPAREFRAQKIDITTHSAVIFTSKNAIIHFFRLCEELKIPVPQEKKYFCISETVALYLQNYIVYRKRKVFFGADGSNKNLFDLMEKHKKTEKFLYVCSENQQDSDIVSWLKANKYKFSLGFMYRTQSNDVKALLENNQYDLICFFTPSGIKSLFENFPKFKQKGTLIGAFGSNTLRAAEEVGLKLNIQAPKPQAQNMAAAIQQFLNEYSKGVIVNG